MSQARRERRGEARLPGILATLVAVALYAALPTHVLVGPRFVLPVLEVVLLFPLVAINPIRITRETRWSRELAITLAAGIALTNTTVLVLLIRKLTSGHAGDGKQLLVGAAQVWLTNVIAYGLLYWELDRGGPVARTQKPRNELQDADFRFSQDENDDAVVEVARSASGKSDWVPTLVDYLYVSVTNSAAFSPTDTMPLRPRTKILMAMESISALVLSVVVIAYGVGSIK